MTHCLKPYAYADHGPILCVQGAQCGGSGPHVTLQIVATLCVRGCKTHTTEVMVRCHIRVLIFMEAQNYLKAR